MSVSQKVALIIMDGWGKGPNPAVSAIAQARTPFIDSLSKSALQSELVTHSESVGLPEGQMGNSEVGHLNIGAGRIVYQELQRINIAIKNGSLRDHAMLQNTFRYCAETGRPLHLMGLVSDGGVHSHINHLLALCRYANEAGVQKTFIHAFTDGRDCDPKSGYGFLEKLLKEIASLRVQLATVCGRYYAMDRDKRWERIKLAYDMLVKGEGKKTTDPLWAVKASYERGVTDEFITPIVCTARDGNPIATIRQDDAAICFNFRTDRCREITTALTQRDFDEHGMNKLNLHFTTLTRYDDTYQNVNVIFENQNLQDTLGEVLANCGKTQLRAAETEKYPHVTFFFSGGREEPFAGEKRILIPSPKVATYDLQPEMSAIPLTDAVINEIQSAAPDFICLNYANPDMVGHTGVFSAAVKACETVDTCVQRIAETARSLGYMLLITADHGNADYMINEDGSPNTAHTMNPVPLFLVGHTTDTHLQNGKLADLAPTILKLMSIPKPAEMDGHSLL